MHRYQTFRPQPLRNGGTRDPQPPSLEKHLPAPAWTAKTGSILLLTCLGLEGSERTSQAQEPTVTIFVSGNNAFTIHFTLRPGVSKYKLCSRQQRANDWVTYSHEMKFGRLAKSCFLVSFCPTALRTKFRCRVRALCWAHGAPARLVLSTCLHRRCCPIPSCPLFRQWKGFRCIITHPYLHKIEFTYGQGGKCLVCE